MKKTTKEKLNQLHGLLSYCRFTGPRSKVIGRNTTARERNPKGGSWDVKRDNPRNAIAVRLHNTDILTYFADGRIGVYFGGWNTITTRDRMNAWLPRHLRVYTERGNPYLYIGTRGASKRYMLDESCGASPLIVKPDGTLTKKDAKACKQREQLARETRLAKARSQRAERKRQKYAAALDVFVYHFRCWAMGGDYKAAVTSCGNMLEDFGSWLCAPYDAAVRGLYRFGQTLYHARDVTGTALATPPKDAQVFYGWHYINRGATFQLDAECLVIPKQGFTAHNSVRVYKGQTLYVPAGCQPCHYGLHSSAEPRDARNFCNGAILCFVECWGEQVHQSDKSVAQFRRVIAMVDMRAELNGDGQYHGDTLNDVSYTTFVKYFGKELL